MTIIDKIFCDLKMLILLSAIISLSCYLLICRSLCDRFIEKECHNILNSVNKKKCEPAVYNNLRFIYWQL